MQLSLCVSTYPTHEQLLHDGHDGARVLGLQRLVQRVVVAEALERHVIGRQALTLVQLHLRTQRGASDEGRSSCHRTPTRRFATGTNVGGPPVWIPVTGYGHVKPWAHLEVPSAGDGVLAAVKVLGRAAENRLLESEGGHCRGVIADSLVLTAANGHTAISPSHHQPRLIRGQAHAEQRPR